MQNQAPTTLSPAHERTMLLLLTSVHFTHILDYMLVMPLGARLMGTLHIVPSQFSYLVAAYSLAAALSGFTGGFFLDRFERKHALLFLYSGFTLATVACGLTTSYHLLLAARFAAGAFGGVAGSVVFSMVSDVVPPERRGRAMGFVMSAFPIASVVGIPISLWLTATLNWHAPFLLLGALGLAIVVACFKLLPQVPKHPTAADPVRQMKEILCHPVHQRGFALSAALVFAGGTVIPFMSPSLVANVGLTEHQLTFIYLFGGFAVFFCTRLVGAWTDRFDKVSVIAGTAAVAAVGAILVTRLGHTSLGVALIFTTLFFIGMGTRFPPVIALITNSIEARYRGGFMSVNSAVQQAANSLGSAAAGWMLATAADGQMVGYENVGLLSAVFMGLTFVLGWRLKQLAPHAALPGGGRAGAAPAGA